MAGIGRFPLAEDALHIDQAIARDRVSAPHALGLMDFPQWNFRETKTGMFY